MAQKKEHKLVSAETGEQLKPGEKPQAAPNLKPAKELGNPKALRIGAVCLWAAAILFEVLAVWRIFKIAKLSGAGIEVPGLQIGIIIGLIVLDLACVIIGSQLWKKANHIDPASEANPTKFWLWNNMGVIVCVVAFVPLVILMLANKDLDKKTKAICTVVAVIALLIGGLSGYDFNPVSAEQLDAAVEALGDEQVYWAPFGKVYHTHEDCSSLNQSETLTVGTVEQAVAAGRTRLCYFCAQQDNITTVVTDGD